MIDEVLFPILYKSIDHLMPSVAGEIWSAGLGDGIHGPAGIGLGQVLAWT